VDSNYQIAILANSAHSAQDVVRAVSACSSASNSWPLQT